MEQEINLQGAAPTTKPTAVEILLTPAAATRALAMMAKDGRKGLALRPKVEGGGCSGLQYNLLFDDQRGPDDIEFSYAGVAVLVDAYSAQFLNGVTIDYVDALHGAGFKFINPNADRTCGCGSSFSVAD